MDSGKKEYTDINSTTENVLKKSAIVLGYASLVTWLLPLIGIATGVGAILLSRNENQNSRKTAMLLGIIGVLGSLINGIIGFLMTSGT